MKLKCATPLNTPIYKLVTRPSPSKVISQATKEVQSMVERRNNILVFNVPESECNMKNQVVRDDTNIFLELCNIVEAGVQESDIGTMNRIGKKNQKMIIKGKEKIVSRPLLITLCNANVKHKVMKNECKLGKADDKFRMMSIKHDMTQEERDQDKKLRAEAKDKQEINKSENFLYLVKGMPWERHMQKINIRKAEQNLDQEGSVGPQETETA